MDVLLIGEAVVDSQPLRHLRRQPPAGDGDHPGRLGSRGSAQELEEQGAEEAGAEEDHDVPLPHSGAAGDVDGARHGLAQHDAAGEGSRERHGVRGPGHVVLGIGAVAEGRHRIAWREPGR